jgi:hypothetical protein
MAFQLSRVNFGAAISTPATPPFTSFTLKQGIYQIHLDGFFFNLQLFGPTSAQISAFLTT